VGEGEVKTLEEIKQWLVEHQSVLQERYQVSELGIFGSYIRQEQTEASDVDVLVEFSKTPSLLKFVNLENYLSDNLGVKVDLVHKAGLKPRIGDRILAEVVYL
jgi:hypothetical protein